MEENSGKIKAFNRNDEQFLEAFVIFCGLGIQNTQMYEAVERAMAKQMVTLEVRLNQGSLYIIHSCFFTGTPLLRFRPAILGSAWDPPSLFHLLLAYAFPYAYVVFSGLLHFNCSLEI